MFDPSFPSSAYSHLQFQLSPQSQLSPAFQFPPVSQHSPTSQLSPIPQLSPNSQLSPIAQLSQQFFSQPHQFYSEKASTFHESTSFTGSGHLEAKLPSQEYSLGKNSQDWLIEASRKSAKYQNGQEAPLDLTVGDKLHEEKGNNDYNFVENCYNSKRGRDHTEDFHLHKKIKMEIPKKTSKAIPPPFQLPYETNDFLPKQDPNLLSPISFSSIPTPFLSLFNVGSPLPSPSPLSQWLPPSVLSPPITPQDLAPPISIPSSTRSPTNVLSTSICTTIPTQFSPSLTFKTIQPSQQTSPITSAAVPQFSSSPTFATTLPQFLTTMPQLSPALSQSFPQLSPTLSQSLSSPPLMTSSQQVQSNFKLQPTTGIVVQSQQNLPPGYQYVVQIPQATRTNHIPNKKTMRKILPKPSTSPNGPQISPTYSTNQISPTYSTKQISPTLRTKQKSPTFNTKQQNQIVPQLQTESSYNFSGQINNQQLQLQPIQINSSNQLIQVHNHMQQISPSQPIQPNNHVQPISSSKPIQQNNHNLQPMLTSQSIPINNHIQPIASIQPIEINNHMRPMLPNQSIQLNHMQQMMSSSQPIQIKTHIRPAVNNHLSCLSQPQQTKSIAIGTSASIAMETLIEKSLNNVRRWRENGKTLQVYYCCLCSSPTDTVDRMKSHIRLLHDPNNKISHQKYKDDDSQNQDELDGRWECSECQQICSSPSNLSRHQLLHTGRGGGERCGGCGRTLPTPSALQTHQMECKEAKPYRCDWCGKRYVLDARLRHHKQECSLSPNTTKFTCKVCSKIFYNQQKYAEHVPIHSFM